MKKLKEKQRVHLENRRKKALARRKRLAAIDAEKNPPSASKVSHAPRHMRRKKALVGTTYWRGDRFVLENYKGR